MYEVGLDVRSQLRVFEQIDEVERKKRDARERDILMRAAKVSDYLHFACSVFANQISIIWRDNKKSNALCLPSEMCYSMEVWLES